MAVGVAVGISIEHGFRFLMKLADFEELWARLQRENGLKHSRGIENIYFLEEEAHMRMYRHEVSVYTTVQPCS